MSGGAWIDGFFRKRMERRHFPVEDGEFEDVRALLEQRNATGGAVRGRGLSKWWLSALLPLAGLLWWAFGGDVRGPAEQVAATTESGPAIGPNGAEQHARGPGSSVAPHDADPSIAAVGPRSVAATGPQAAPVNEAVAPAQAGDDVRAARSAGTSRSGSNGRIAANGKENTEARDADAKGIADSDRGGTSPGRVGSNARLDAGEEEQQRVHAAPLPEQAGMLSQEPGRSQADPKEGTGLSFARNGADAVLFMQPRWSAASVVAVQEPVRRDVEAFRGLPKGELHFFGAALAVRTRSSAGDRSDAGPGSVVGLEYRVRVKRFAWATGIHYGSYALTADHGATDVKLNFVEVPLLASVQLNRGRFGVAMQGGLSMDLLFNSRGRYQVGGDLSGAALPDDAFRTVNCSWSLRPQAIYHVSEHLSVNAGPLWKGQLSEVANTGPLEGARMNSSGIAIGITWRLERSTF